MHLQATGTYVRFPTRYRFPQPQLCTHGKWQRYHTNATEGVADAHSWQYNGPRMSAEQWWADWEQRLLQPDGTEDGGSGARMHLASPTPSLSFDVAGDSVVGPALTLTACVLEGLLVFVVLARCCRWRSWMPRSKET